MRRLLFVLCLALPGLADDVYLKNGSMIDGDVDELGEQVVVRTAGGSMTIDRAQVERIVRKESRAAEYVRRAALVAEGDAEGHRALAAWCAQKGLQAERKREFEAVLALSPDDAEARRELGFVRVAGKWVEVDRAWAEQATPHFFVRTDTGRAREIGDALEAGLSAFQEHYAAVLVRPAPQGLITVLAFRERDAFVAKMKETYPGRTPENAGFAQAVNGFSLPSDRLMLFYFPDDAALGGVETLLHEMTHVLVNEMLVPSDAARGLTPDEVQDRFVEGKGVKWLHEGFACYVGGSRIERGVVRLGEVPDGGTTQRMARIAADALANGKSVPLGALVEGGLDEFVGADCVLWYAEAWTFVHFLHHGLDGRLRPSFDAIAQSAARGEGGREAVERALGVTIEELAPAWRQYVRGLAK